MFLFKEDSGIHEILKQMKSHCDCVLQHELYRNDYKVISSDDKQMVLKSLDNTKTIVIDSHDIPEFQNLEKIANDARKNFKESLTKLEEKIKPYIQFETIKGWTFF
ncbi:hypothetical protein [Commensalibacter nepenthis]|uniref:Uncharacterized protein n=1 Tax=Commensalibacter nepenthis TaxID=3043872 RepID=A0ABT6Q6T8_9PROT|nr:hypothetical protein [Commensalibacter sp. TBRC 10068]MDI2112614.1 hypothetical protein [Commensalibacter sp. TBRC 10068]